MSNVDRAREAATDAALDKHNGEHITDSMHAAIVMAKLEAGIEKLNALAAEMKEIEGFKNFFCFSSIGASIGASIELNSDAFNLLFRNDPLVVEVERPEYSKIERKTTVDGVTVSCEERGNFKMVRV